VQQCLLAFSLALLGWMLTIYSSRMFGALNLFRGLLLQELVALVVYLAIVFPLRSSLEIPGVALAFGIGQVTGGLVSVGLIAWRLDLRLGAIGVDAMLPAVARAAPVIVALGLVRLGLDESGASSAVTAVLGALVAAGAAAATLSRAQWPELDSVRGFVRRRRRRPAVRQ
jgi:hypothetical protein